MRTMPSAGFFALFDDIASLLDDVAAMSKLSAKKAAGVLGDDLALNAKQVTGVLAERELPVIWAVAKGSLLNKLILVPLAMLVSAFLPWLIQPLLMLGGLYLCYEGFHKIAQRWLGGHGEPKPRPEERLASRKDLRDYERRKIQGAIRTDFVLSAEIVVLVLGVVREAPLPAQIVSLSLVAAGVTLVVYGLVAAIVKLDDLGVWMLAGAGEGRRGAWRRALGSALLAAAPRLMKALSVLGTAAMFLVGGGILLHGLPWLHHAVEERLHGLDLAAGLQPLARSLAGGLVGVLAGALLALGERALAHLKPKPA